LPGSPDIPAGQPHDRERFSSNKLKILRETKTLPDHAADQRAAA
jgi:hypothetical protein